MVSLGSIAGMIVQVIIGIILPVALVIYFRKKQRISFRALAVGVLVFIVFSQVLEKALHFYLLFANPATAAWLKNPWLFACYGALAAGIFEEVGRWAGFTYLLKKRRERKDGIALGLGHGGFETLMIGVVTGVQGIIFSLLINNGKLEQTLGAQVPPDQITKLKEQLTATPALDFWLGGLERIPALVMQIALSLIVLYGVRRRNIIFLLYAVLLHALVDFIPGLYQTRVVPLWLAECFIWAAGIVCVLIITKSRNWFDKPAMDK
jgi:uncharacterized membrane protein YhfC